jgi:hypothetical protein
VKEENTAQVNSDLYSTVVLTLPGFLLSDLGIHSETVGNTNTSSFFISFFLPCSGKYTSSSSSSSLLDAEKFFTDSCGARTRPWPDMKCVVSEMGESGRRSRGKKEEERPKCFFYDLPSGGGGGAARNRTSLLCRADLDQILSEREESQDNQGCLMMICANFTATPKLTAS